MLPRSVDVIVIGAGPNGLVSAALLADAGWSVLVLEAQPELGGAVRSARKNGWVMDRFSACYPLAAASPVITGLELDRFGLRWAHSDPVLVHPDGPDDHSGAAIYRNRLATAAKLAEERQADGETWLALCAQWDRISEPFLQALLTRWPPVRPALRLRAALGGSGEFLRFARFLSLPVHRMAAELFQGERGRLLLAGNAAHADAPALAPVSGTMGWLLAMLAQDVGFPAPVGGADRLTDALASRARAAGAELLTDEPVAGIDVRDGRAVGVRTASGQAVMATRAILAGVSAPALYTELLDAADLPGRLSADLDSFDMDLPTVKVNYRLRSTPLWTALPGRTSGVLHVGADSDGLVHWSADLETDRLPRRPFALVGQMTTIDPSRSPDSTEAMWAYSHLPRGRIADSDAMELASRITATIAEHAPGFGDLILDSDVQTPASLVRDDANLVCGGLGGGTSQLFQQLIFRPVPGLGGPYTPVDRLYLASAAAHPGGGVHGGCGALAARAALADSSMLSQARRRARAAIFDRLYRSGSSSR
jgi:phytoene dehydrogenase-like protein